VGPAKGGEDLEAGRGQRPDCHLVNERIGDQAPGEQTVTGCGALIVERAERGDAQQGSTVEAVEALCPAGVSPQ